MQLKRRENSADPIPFHDGMHEDKVRLQVDCGKCGHQFDEHLLSSLDRGEEWFRSLIRSEQRDIANQFGYQFEILGSNSRPYLRFKNGSIAYLVNLSCPKCKVLTLAAVDFYEKQPARYIATLVGIAEAETA